MPTPIDKTIGTATANSYVDVTDADAYFDDRLDAAKWTATVSDDKTRALLMAAAQLQNENWLGSRVKSTQSLAWPRVNVRKIDGYSGGGGYGIGYGECSYSNYYTSTEIPKPVKDAQCELALDFLAGVPPTPSAPTIESFTLDELNVKFSSSQPAPVVTSRASRLIAMLVAGNQLVRG